MEGKYSKDITSVVDVLKGIDCVNLSMGANNRESFSWIVNHLELFKQESIKNYNRVICSLKKQKSVNLYLIIFERKDGEFSAVEKYLGIWHKHKNATFKNFSKDYYVDNSLRFAFAEIDELNIDQLSTIQSKTLIFAREERELVDVFKELKTEGDFFDCFYHKGYLLATFRDFWSEGNALVFYLKDKTKLTEILEIARKESFIDS